MFRVFVWDMFEIDKDVGYASARRVKMDKIIKPVECLRGEIVLPGDKSISHRAVFIGGISEGRTLAKNFLKAEDSERSVSAFREMGVKVEIENKNITVFGSGLKGLKKPGGELYLGNSGTTMRILPGILAGQDFEATLTGDESLSKRPMGRIMEPLKGMGVNIKSKDKNDFPPLTIRGGGVKSIRYTTTVASAQVKSCILFAGLYAHGTTAVTEPFASRDHTERMLELFGAKIAKKGTTVSIEGGCRLCGRELYIPGDISSAAFFIMGACILEGSDLTVRGVGLNHTRLGFLNTLRKMGADIEINKKIDAAEPYGDIRVRYAPLKAAVVEEGNIPFLIDEIPALFIAASQAEGKTVIKGVGELRVKETDRVDSMLDNLGRMGIDTECEKNNVAVNGRKHRLRKARLQSYGDHRTAMSAAIAALASDGECVIENADCVNISFPDFFEILDYLKR